MKLLRSCLSIDSIMCPGKSTGHGEINRKITQTQTSQKKNQNVGMEREHECDGKNVEKNCNMIHQNK